MHETFGAIRSQNFIYIICSQRSHYSGQSTNCGCHCQGAGAKIGAAADATMWHIVVARNDVYLHFYMQMPIPMRSNNNTYPSTARVRERESIALNFDSVPQNCNKIFWLIHFALNSRVWAASAGLYLHIFTIIWIWMDQLCDPQCLQFEWMRLPIRLSFISVEICWHKRINNFIIYQRILSANRNFGIVRKVDAHHPTLWVFGISMHCERIRQKAKSF